MAHAGGWRGRLRGLGQKRPVRGWHIRVCSHLRQLSGHRLSESDISQRAQGSRYRLRCSINGIDSAAGALLADSLGCFQEDLHGLIDQALGLGIISRAQCSNLWVDIDTHADLNHKVFPGLHAAAVSDGSLWCSRMFREETTLDFLDSRLADPE